VGQLDTQLEMIGVSKLVAMRRNGCVAESAQTAGSGGCDQ
jgi:hypothetical protein